MMLMLWLLHLHFIHPVTFFLDCCCCCCCCSKSKLCYKTSIIYNRAEVFQEIFIFFYIFCYTTHTHTQNNSQSTLKIPFKRSFFSLHSTFPSKTIEEDFLRVVHMKFERINLCSLHFTYF